MITIITPVYTEYANDLEKVLADMGEGFNFKELDAKYRPLANTIGVDMVGLISCAGEYRDRYKK